MITLKTHFEKKTHIIWDWNGTLLNDIQFAVDIANQMLREANLPVIDVNTYREHFCFPVSEYYRKLGFDVSQFGHLAERFNELFQGGLNQCDLWPGARETLAFVRDSGRMQSLLSASEHRMLETCVDHYRIREYFHHVVGIADKMAASKLEQGRALMKRAGVPPEQTVLVGDTDHDLEVGKALGVDVILVEHGAQCPTRLRAVHDKVVKLF